MKAPQDIILQPIVSEKSYDRMGEGIYQFKVAKGANKHQIKDAVETLFKVTVNKVNTVTVVRKPKRRGVFHGFTPSWKKAIVTLKEGDSIPFFEGIA
ncbi:MAG: 50S ribosomal protein L23 [Candidatus Riflebacteria bacterium HGW-Riflebacteria-2]|jgi:large subunit ribosomal protein L23|nr:MAG: 50S ribosomal protein L23 [Candidatus Riflebacteria bacterium HGW-Riflebacteria-2]